MGYEMGLTKQHYDEKNKETYTNPYWRAVGWESQDLYKTFVKIAIPGSETIVGEDPYFKDIEYEIEVKKLSFIKELHTQLAANKYYSTFSKLCRLGFQYADEYLESLNFQQKAEFRLGFYLPEADEDIQDIAIELLKHTEDFYPVMESLYEGYKKICADGVKTVVLYG